MVDQFFWPHTIMTKTNAGEWTRVDDCRDQPNTSAKVVTLADRTSYVFTSLVFLPKSKTKFKPGQEVRIVGSNGEIRIEGNVKKFSFDELENNRLWI